MSEPTTTAEIEKAEAEAKKRQQFKTGNDVTDYVKELTNLENKYHGEDSLMGVTTMTVPTYISSNRAIMYASHLKQFVNLKYRETPRMRTNYEDVVGKESSYYHTAEDDMEVYAVVDKFPEVAPNLMYFKFFHSKKNHKYYLEIKQNGVECPERFGFHINNDAMDNLKVGDTIEKGKPLWKSCSYDEEDLYGFGMNARVAWAADNWTIEDAIKIRKGFADKLISYEEETVSVHMNDNDFMRNMYGDEKYYKGFPDAGGLLKDNMLCATSHRVDSQVLYDMKKSNLKEINVLDDRIYYAKSSHNARVMDIEIYPNKSLDEIPDTDQYKQIRYYIANHYRYYQEINRICKEIVDSGEEFDSDIGFWCKRSSDILDENYGFSNGTEKVKGLVMEFKVEREVGVNIGNKLTGRYGNKGVVAKIVPDEEMMYTKDENGNPVYLDMIFNVLGVINRLVSMPLYEVAFNMQGDQVMNKIRHEKTLRGKEKWLFKFTSFFNDRGMHDQLKKYYAGLSTAEKHEFFESVETDGIYIHIPPMWEKEPLYDRLKRMYKELGLERKLDCYVHKFGREIKVMRKMVVGEQYVLKLKQSSKKGFSGRSIGYINMKGLPDKTNRMRTNLQIYSTTPIKNGIDDCNNMNIGVDAKDIAKMHLFYRNSLVGRRELSKLLTEDPLDFEDFDLRAEYTNRNVEILNAYLLCCGKGIIFPGDTVYIDKKSDAVETYMFEHETYLTDRETMRNIIIDKYLRPKFEERGYIGSKEWIEGEYQEFKKHELLKRNPGNGYIYIKDDIHK